MSLNVLNKPSMWNVEFQDLHTVHSVHAISGSHITSSVAQIDFKGYNPNWSLGIDCGTKNHCDKKLMSYSLFASTCQPFEYVC